MVSFMINISLDLFIIVSFMIFPKIILNSGEVNGSPTPSFNLTFSVNELLMVTFFSILFSLILTFLINFVEIFMSFITLYSYLLSIRPSVCLKSILLLVHYWGSLFFYSIDLILNISFLPGFRFVFIYYAIIFHCQSVFVGLCCNVFNYIRQSCSFDFWFCPFLYESDMALLH